jgi:hypothetical protein
MRNNELKKLKKKKSFKREKLRIKSKEKKEKRMGVEKNIKILKL